MRLRDMVLHQQQGLLPGCLTGASQPEITAYVPEVDALRAYAMGLVILYHGGITPFGWSGVWVFFVISGFAITTSLMASQQRFGDRSWHIIGRFHVRRARRIWPLYYTFVLANVLLLLALHHTGPLEDLPYLLTFTYNLKLIFTQSTSYLEWRPFGPLWTLAVEEQVYLIFPLLFVFLSRRGLRILFASLLILAPGIRMLWATWLSQKGLSDDRIALGVYAFAPAHLDAFAAGGLIALNRFAITEQRNWGRLMFGAAACAIVLYVTHYAGLQADRSGEISVGAFRNLFSGVLYGDGREIWLYTIVWGAAAGFLMALLSGEPTMTRLCRLPGVQWLGRISYAGYIVNSSVYVLVTHLLPLSDAGPLSNLLSRVAGVVLAFTLITILASLCFWFVERPFLAGRGTFR